MPERHNANLFEVLISQVAQNGKINIVLGKALNVLLHTELFEPVRNLLHRGPAEYLWLASTSAEWCVFFLAAEDCSQSGAGTHVRLAHKWTSLYVRVMWALPRKRTSELGLRYVRRNSSGSLAMFAAIPRASSLVSNLVAFRPWPHHCGSTLSRFKLVSFAT